MFEHVLGTNYPCDGRKEEHMNESNEELKHGFNVKKCCTNSVILNAKGGWCSIGILKAMGSKKVGIS